MEALIFSLFILAIAFGVVLGLFISDQFNNRWKN